MAPPSNLRAISYGIAGFAIWVFADTCMKLASEAALPPYESVAFLGMCGILMAVGKSAPRGNIKKLWPQNPRAQLLRSLLALGSNFFNAIALMHLPLTLFYVTVFTAPMMTALLAAVVLREPLNWQKMLAITLGFAGVVIAINPFSGNASGDWIGYAAATTSTACFAINSVWLRVMTQSESTDSLVFFTGLVEVLFGVVLMIFYHAVPLTLWLFIILSAMSLLTVLGNIFNFIALKFTAAANIMQFHYTQIITGALLGYLIWHDIPSLHLMIGAVVIIGSGLYMAHHVSRSEKTSSGHIV